MTASLLAERVGVAPSMVSHYELEKNDPKPHVMARIASVLSVPESHFLKAPLSSGEPPYLYRSKAASTKRARESAEVRHRWFLEILEFVSSAVELPAVQLDDIGGRKAPSEISDEQIEEAAAEVRRRWGLGDGPIANMILTAESKGCAVSRFAFGAEDLNSFSHYDRVPSIALNADSISAVRGRFDCAHELAHLVLHRSVKRADAEKPETHKRMEMQAHRFAAAFLFPASSFVDEVYSTSFDALLSLKRRWKVSVQMMIRRARDLDLINQDKYERTFRDLSRRGFRTREPLDDEIQPEGPTVLNKAIRLMLDQRLVTREELCYQLRLDVGDIEVLAHLPTGFLATERWGEVVEIRERVHTKTGGGDNTDNVLQFPKR